MPQLQPIGIDLGTTLSAAARIDGHGKSAMIPNGEGDLLTPSVVSFTDAEIVVGKEAKRAAALRPDRTAEYVKRDMGGSVYSRSIRDEYLPPEVIQACILRKLKHDISQNVGPDFAVVITVPAFFDEPRRRATAVAGDIAGLNVLDIINEPTAAALAFAEHEAGKAELQRILVYDLGGGTFDATLLEVQPTGFHTKATDGDVYLGGRDWDLRLADLVAAKFVERYREDPRSNPAAGKRLLTDVERLKHTLSSRNRGSVEVDHAGSSLEVEVTRPQFEKACDDLLERTAHTIQQLIVESGFQWREIDHVLLVGGSTRMPMVTQMLETLSGKTPNSVLHPDEAVARGAAIYAKYLLDQRNDRDLAPRFRITNVNSHSLGISGVEEDTQEKVNAILIRRNTPLPAKATRTFVTHRENQRSIVIRVLEGESALPNDCTVIGDTVIRNLLPDLPKGHPVEVTYEYEPNGRLRVSTNATGGDGRVQLEIDRIGALADFWISRWKMALAQDRGWPPFREVLLERKRTSEKVVELEMAQETPTAATTQPAAAQPAMSQPATAQLAAAQLVAAQQASAQQATAQPTTPQPASAKPAPPRPPAHTTGAASPRSRFTTELLKIVLGGMAGVVLSQLVLWWAFRVDPINLAPKLPSSVRFIAPKDLTQAEDSP